MSITPQPCKGGAQQEGDLCLPGQPVVPTVPADPRQPAVPPEPLPGPTSADLQLGDLPLWAIAAFALLLLTVAVLVYVLVRLARRAKAATDLARRVVGPDHGPEPPGNSTGYQALLDAFIGTYDLTASDVVRAHIQKSLRGVGITPITPRPGDPFDLGVHNGVSGVRAPSPNMARRIVRVLRPGWRSDEKVLRPADVEVYKD